MISQDVAVLDRPVGEATFGFTGHRPQKIKEQCPAVLELDDMQLHCALTSLASWFLREHTPKRALVGMAVGWDLAVAEACLMVDVPFVAHIPFWGQEASWAEWQRDMYHSRLHYAEDLVYYDEGMVIPPDYPKQRFYHARNRGIVDECHLLVALWSGCLGGTRSTLHYADGSGRRPSVNLWDNLVKGINGD